MRLVAVSAYSADGSDFDGAMYISTNSGTSWTQSAWLDDWTCVASSAGGSNLFAATSGGGLGLIYTSADGGATWAPTTAPQQSWLSLACSADGTTLVASSDFGIFISWDSGVTWATNELPAGVYVEAAVACSADGSNIVAASPGGLIATLQPAGRPDPRPPSPRLSLTASGPNLILGWPVPSTSFVLQQCTDLSSGNWLEITNQPVLDAMHLQNQVMLSLSPGCCFYRLKQR
jgi:hypothetical protein